MTKTRPVNVKQSSNQNVQREINRSNRVSPQPTRDVKAVNISKESLHIDRGRTFSYEKRTRNMVNDVLADGYVSIAEKGIMKENHDFIIRDFLVATDLMEKMKRNPTAYSAAEMDAMHLIVTHLMRARELSLAKMHQVEYANFIPPQEKKLRMERRKRKEHLDINFNLYQIFALNGNANEVIRYAREQEKTRRLTPAEIERTEKRIMDVVNQIVENGQDERHVRRLLEQSQDRTI